MRALQFEYIDVATGLPDVRAKEVRLREPIVIKLQNERIEDGKATLFPAYALRKAVVLRCLEIISEQERTGSSEVGGLLLVFAGGPKAISSRHHIYKRQFRNGALLVNFLKLCLLKSRKSLETRVPPHLESLYTYLNKLLICSVRRSVDSSSPKPGE